MNYMIDFVTLIIFTVFLLFFANELYSRRERLKDAKLFVLRYFRDNGLTKTMAMIKTAGYDRATQKQLIAYVQTLSSGR